MHKLIVCQRLRREFGKPTLALLIYYGIMNVAVILVAIADAVVFALGSMQSDAGMDVLTDAMIYRIMSNGWGYIFASIIGFVALLIWKKPHFCFVEIWKAGRPMKPGSFAALTCIFISGQALFQLVTEGMEWIFNLFDMSIMESLESATAVPDSLSMFLYVSLAAPVFEEVLFRGLILRTLQPYGKKFAIFASAYLFGMFHGNIVQSPYAFAVGLVLGYVAAEYSMGWAMVLHMVNNLLLGDSLGRITQFLPAMAQEMIFLALIWGCTIAAILIMTVKRKELIAYMRSGRMHPWCLKSFFSSPSVIVFTCIMGANILLPLLLSVIV